MERHIIETQLSRLGVDLDTAVEEFARLEEISVDSEGDFRIAYAKAFANGTGSVEDRKQQAILACDTEWRVWGKAKTVVIRQKEHVKALHARIEVGRTLASNVRAEASLAKTGITP